MTATVRGASNAKEGDNCYPKAYSPVETSGCDYQVGEKGVKKGKCWGLGKRQEVIRLS